MSGFKEEVLVRAIWRFYLDKDQKWRWQRLSTGDVVVSESRTACMDFDDCVTDAKINGYVFQPSLSKVIQR